MPSFAELLQQGAGNAWLFVPSAILLGALHGLEPGHSKTLMAAFIVAIRGTVPQAIMLGLAATLSHTAVVWVIALGGMYLWQGVAPETFEPWFQLLSGLIIIAMALWMLWRAREDRRRSTLAAGDHGHTSDARSRPQGHGHGDIRQIDTGHGMIEVEIFEDGVPARWRLRRLSGQDWSAEDVTVTTERPDGKTHTFAFRDSGDFMVSADEIPEPHQFMARVNLRHGGHSHDYDLAFVEDRGSEHDHMHEELRGLSVATSGYQDAHQLAHADDIRRRFADRAVTNWQIVVFGLAGGLIPCPAAITVLLLCIQLKEIALGAVLVLCFSIGLAITLVAVGAVAALSVRHATKRFSWFSTVAQRAPYLSGILIILVGVYVAYHGLNALLLA